MFLLNRSHLFSSIIFHIALLVSLLGVICSCGTPTVHRNTVKNPGVNPSSTGTDNSASDDANPIEQSNCDSKENSCGNGGALGLVESRFSSTQGVASDYKIDVPQDISLEKSYGLMIYIHGDGAADYNWFFSDFSKVAKEQNLIPLAVKAPSSDNWSKEPEEKAVYLNQLLQSEIFKKYNIKKSDIYFVGVSSGQSFLTGTFIRLMGSTVDVYNGGAILLCGGMGDATQSLAGADFKQFPLYFKTGTQDFMLEKTKEAVKYYSSQGVKVITDYPEGIGHCRYPLNEAISYGVTQLLQM